MPKITKRTRRGHGAPRTRAPRVGARSRASGFACTPRGRRSPSSRTATRAKLRRPPSGRMAPSRQWMCQRGPQGSSPPRVPVRTVSFSATMRDIVITPARTGKDLAASGRYGVRVPTMKELVEHFLKEYVPTHCKSGTQEVYRSTLDIHVVPRLSSRRAADIERGDIAALPHGLRAIPYQANRTVQVLAHLHTCRGVRAAVERFASLPPYETVPGGEARAVPVRRGIPSPRRDPQGTRGAGSGAAVGRGLNPNSGIDQLSQGRDSHAMLGGCGSRRRRVAVARPEDLGHDQASGRPRPCGATGYSVARRQSLSHPGSQAGQAAARPSVLVAPHPQTDMAQRGATRPSAFVRQWRTAGRRGVTHDRQAARAQPIASRIVEVAGQSKGSTPA